MNNHLIKKFKFPVIFVISMFVISALGIAIYWNGKIALRKRELKSKLENSKYSIIRFEDKNGVDYSYGDVTLNFRKDSFVLFYNEGEVKGKYEILDKSSIRFYNCGNFQEILCNEYTISLTKNGMNLINEESLITSRLLK